MIFLAESKERLDKFLARSLPHHSRSKLERHILNHGVLVQGVLEHKAGLMLRAGWTVEVTEPEETPPQELTPADIPLDVVFEDDHMLVVNKPRGMASHPAPGLSEPTLVHALLARGHSLSSEGGDFRPGIVHRLDKETTGVMMVAKNDAAHRKLAEQLQDKTAGRRYFAILRGTLPEPQMVVKAPIGRHPSNPTLRAIRADGKEAVTHLLRIKRLDMGTLAACRLETGRTHQIRVHLAGLGTPVLGDPLYASAPYNSGPLQLHAAWLRFIHPHTSEEVTVFATPPDDFEGREDAIRDTIERWKGQ